MSYIKRWIDDDFDENIEIEMVEVDDIIEEIEENKREEEEKQAEDEKWNAHVNEVTSMELDLSWENMFDSDDSTIGVEADSISDGLIKSLNNLGCVDIEYISTITGGTPYKDIIEKLKGSIYQNPETWGECFFHGWETKEEYVSGNVRKKLIAARESNEDYNGYFEENVKVLEQVLPTAIDIKDIYVTLGSPWIPTWVIEDFVKMIVAECGFKDEIYGKHIYVHHNAVTGSWELSMGTGLYIYHKAVNIKYGTNYDRRGFVDILQLTLNMQSVAVYDEKKNDKDKTIRVLNKEKTVDVKEKQKLIVERFKSWIWEDEERTRKLYEIYEEKFLCVRTRHFSGAFLEFPNLNENFELYSYQKDAVARILFSPNVLLAHDVGAGKTIVMIAAGMELKRMKKSSKNLYVVPNNIVGQWKDIFLEMYPDANILVVDNRNFKKDVREDTLRKIRDEEYDGIIMTYTVFTAIPIKKESRIEMLKEEMQQLSDSLRNRNAYTLAATKAYSTKRKKLTEMEGEAEKKEGIYFEELGITRLFVDEAHNFKNVPIKTNSSNILGISSSGSKKCADMMNKVRIVQKKNDGKGVVMATGTPITNSITDAYIMQRYLQSGTLELLEIQSFDSWVGMFAESEENFEVDVDTSNYRVTTRFSRFHNIPELTMLLGQFADFHHMDASAGIPDHDGYIDVVVNKTNEFADFLNDISQRVDLIRTSGVERSVDNMLKVTTDGRKAALDLRLVNDFSSFTKDSKAWMCAENVARIYRETEPQRLTQLIFCDTSTPKGTFNLYDELKHLLVDLGVDENEIAYIHDATVESKRERLFRQVRAGEIRILIGSTFKLGLGVNVQTKLIALHHLDVPWRPSDMVQREGRILRQGNENPKVELYRYITEGSFDAYSWQILETKQRFISELLSGMAEDREADDVDNSVLNYAEVKALAIGNELIKERVVLSNELSKFRILQDVYVNNRVRYEKEINELPGRIRELRDSMTNYKLDADFYEENKKEYSQEERRALRLKIIDFIHREEPSKEEKLITYYQGFSVMAPERVSVHNPLVKVTRFGRYTVRIPATDSKVVSKIDKLLNGLMSDYKKMCTDLEEFQNNLEHMKEYLETEQGYAEEIEARKYQIEQIDRELKYNQ